MSDADDRPGRPPVFLERQSYRRRRFADAARALPVFGAFLWLLPLLWWSQADTPPALSTLMIFIFGVWLLLIVAAAVIAPRLQIPDDDRPGRGGRGAGS